MYPVLLSIGETAVPSYLLLMVVGFIAATALGLAIAPRVGLPRREVVDAAIAAVVWGVLGAKLAHCLLEADGHLLGDGSVAHNPWQLLAADPWHWARLFDGGFVWYGGLLLGIAVIYLRARGRGVDLGALADAGAPGIAVGIFLGRLGCFLSGCCYGTASQLPWAIAFHSGHAQGLGPLHPVQLYDAGFGLLLLLFLLWRLPRRRFSGELLALVMVVYPIVRFGLEFVRGDAERQLYFAGLLSTSQIISLMVLPVALYFLIRGYRTKRVV